MSNKGIKLGRLIRTLKNKCPNCSKPLQLREEIERGLNVRYEICTHCGEYKNRTSDDRRSRGRNKERERFPKPPPKKHGGRTKGGFREDI